MAVLACALRKLMCAVVRKLMYKVRNARPAPTQLRAETTDQGGATTVRAAFFDRTRDADVFCLRYVQRQRQGATQRDDPPPVQSINGPTSYLMIQNYHDSVAMATLQYGRDITFTEIHVW